jgi:hypothetical protein
MTALGIFALGLIVLLFSPLLRQLLGAVVWLLVGLWAVGHFLLPPGP